MKLPDGICGRCANRPYLEEQHLAAYYCPHTKTAAFRMMDRWNVHPNVPPELFAQVWEWYGRTVRER